MGASTSKDRQTIRDGVHRQVSAKRGVNRAAMHVSAMTGKLSEVVCMDHHGDGGHQSWCACISRQKSSYQEVNPNCT